ncbi:MAG TPA: TetR/AcrR family transcriptional regulator [Beijerinckiaceae bacterium]|nr:TetR/AcrR family transcriptional regulator [Beijerinckiaceae bacterium]
MATTEVTASGVAAEQPASRDNAKLRQILEGARQVFLADGFDGASMNDIARIAGVSKGTLYVYFASKEALFEALIRAEKTQQAEQICDYAIEGDVRTVLRSFGCSLLGHMTRPESIAHIRIVIAVAPKFPSIGRAFDEAGPQHGARKLAEYLARAAAAGTIEIGDPAVAARHFILLCQGDIFRELLFCVQKEATQDVIDQSVDAAVEAFLRAYGR